MACTHYCQNPAGFAYASDHGFYRDGHDGVTEAYTAEDAIPQAPRKETNAIYDIFKVQAPYNIQPSRCKPKIYAKP